MKVTQKIPFPSPPLAQCGDGKRKKKMKNDIAPHTHRFDDVDRELFYPP